MEQNHTLYIHRINEKVRKCDLKSNLYDLFGEYGTILDIVASQSIKMRGQAFVVFSDRNAATKAMAECQGYELFGKPIVIQYAKSKSDVIAKAEGTFGDKKEQRKRKREAEVEEAREHSIKVAKEAPKQQTPKYIGKDGINHILFVENLPSNSTAEWVETIFKSQQGFIEVRMVPSKPGLAFVEFVDHVTSTQSMQTLQGWEVAPGHALNITYAKH